MCSQCFARSGVSPSTGNGIQCALVGRRTARADLHDFGSEATANFSVHVTGDELVMIDLALPAWVRCAVSVQCSCGPALKWALDPKYLVTIFVRGAAECRERKTWSTNL